MRIHIGDPTAKETYCGRPYKKKWWVPIWQHLAPTKIGRGQSSSLVNCKACLAESESRRNTKRRRKAPTPMS